MPKHTHQVERRKTGANQLQSIRRTREQKGYSYSQSMAIYLTDEHMACRNSRVRLAGLGAAPLRA
jgi:hypothetical protein